MKNNIIKAIFIFLTMISLKVMSQTLNISPGANNLNPNLDKYVGMWKWEGNNKSFTIIFKKENIILPPVSKNVKADVLYGFHKYTDGQLMVENSLSFSNNSYSEGKSSILGGLGRSGLGNVLLGSITHISKNRKNVDFIIEYLDPTHIKLVSLKNPEGVRLRLSSELAFDWSISLPQDIILTKQ